MGSYDAGKSEVCEWIRNNFDTDCKVLDVGACDGIWHGLLPEYYMDAVEVYQPNAEYIRGKYAKVYCMDVAEFDYRWYDLIIFGDVIEHMDVQTAQKVLAYAHDRCCDMVIAVPFLYQQGELYGNPYERHIQSDLTAELFAERYPDYDVLFQPTPNYCYYHKKGEDNG